MLLLDPGWDNLRMVGDSKFKYFILHMGAGSRYNMKMGAGSERNTGNAWKPQMCDGWTDEPIPMSNYNSVGKGQTFIIWVWLLRLP